MMVKINGRACYDGYDFCWRFGEFWPDVLPAATVKYFSCLYFCMCLLWVAGSDGSGFPAALH